MGVFEGINVESNAGAERFSDKCQACSVDECADLNALEILLG